MTASDPKNRRDAKIGVRQAGPNDVDRIYALELACSLNPWTRKGMLDELTHPSAVVLVLEETDARVIGFICSRIVLDELQILEVAIHPDHRERGYGSILIYHLLSMTSTQKVTRATLEVRVSNHPAIRLYEKCGFAVDGIRKGYYQNGEDAMLMSRKTDS